MIKTASSAPASPTTTSGKHMITRIATLFAAAAAMVGIAFGTASPASASVAASGGSGFSVLGCGASGGMTGNIYMTPQSGFTTQSVAVRLYVQDVTHGVGSWEPNWTYTTVNFRNGVTGAFSENRSLATGINYRIYVDYAWWNGRTWTYAGEWLNDYPHRTAYYNSPDTTYCEMY